MSQWETATQAAQQQHHSAPSADHPNAQQYRFPPDPEPEHEVALPPTYPAELANADLPRLEEPNYDAGGGLNGYGIAAIGVGAAGTGFGFLPNPPAMAGENGSSSSFEHSFGASFPYMFPSWYDARFLQPTRSRKYRGRSRLTFRDARFSFFRRQGRGSERDGARFFRSPQRPRM